MKEKNPLFCNRPYPLIRLTSLIFATIAALSSDLAFGTAGDRPNIVFIFSDDHCQQALSAYDPERITTPNMDRLAKEGMMFNRCYVTNAICGPSRAVIQTGKYSHINGFAVNGIEAANLDAALKDPIVAYLAKHWNWKN